MKRYGLVMATNYSGTTAALGGCLQDGWDWQDALDRRGHEVTSLLGPRASRGAMVAALTEGVGRARYGDRLVVTWSGHGSWVPDADGDEPDGRDECILPDDFQTAGVITDDDLHSVFRARRFGARILFLSDSCYSGSVQRAFGGSGAGRPRFLPPMYFLTGTQLVRAYQAETSPPSKPRQTAALLSACADTEVAYDAQFDGRPNGAMTRAALDALGDEGSATLAGWHRNIRRRLPSAAHPQTPQLGASWWQRRWATLD